MKRFLAVAAIVAACACSKAPTGPQPTPGPTTHAPSPSQSPSVPPSVNVPPATQGAIVGAQLTLRRSANATVNVNVLEVNDNARGSAQPPPGTRWVSVRIEISNPGGPAYTEHPYDGAFLVAKSARGFKPAAQNPFAPALGRTITIGRGAFSRGFVAFALPRSEVILSIRFRPSGGTAPDTGDWH